eukprot:3103238-Alexandrium_andersonii.AAC.1
MSQDHPHGMEHAFSKACLKDAFQCKAQVHSLLHALCRCSANEAAANGKRKLAASSTAECRDAALRSFDNLVKAALQCGGGSAIVVRHPRVGLLPHERPTVCGRDLLEVQTEMSHCASIAENKRVIRIGDAQQLSRPLPPGW